MSRGPANLNRLAYFAAVVDAGSFTRAAERLGITKAVVSQQVARLEEEVGATLLLRTTRSVRPTDAGQKLHARCAVILRESAAAFDELAHSTGVPHGTLRVTAPFDYGMTVVVPVVTEYTRLYPTCEVSLSLSDQTLDPQTIDVAIRVGWLRDSSLTARRLGTFDQRLVAAPKLMMDTSRLRRPDELAALPFVVNRSLPEPLTWRFTRDARTTRTVRMSPRLLIDATPGVHAAVLAGAGISVLPNYLVDADIADGKLVEVLPQWKLRGGGIYALLASTRFRPAKTTLFVDLLRDVASGRRA